MPTKFLKCFKALQSNPGAKLVCVCKVTTTPKSHHPNIDDTKTEDDSDDGEMAASPGNDWMDEWTSYINAADNVPNGMGLVCWWGVQILLLYSRVSLLTNTHSRTILDAWNPIPNVAFNRP